METRTGGRWATPPPPTTTPPASLPGPPRLRRAEGAAADVRWDPAACATAVGEQAVEDTLTNPTDDRLSYVIQVTWIDVTADVPGRGIAVVRGARPDEETMWTLTGGLTAQAAQCAINVVRGDLVETSG